MQYLVSDVVHLLDRDALVNGKFQDMLAQKSGFAADLHPGLVTPEFDGSNSALPQISRGGRFILDENGKEKRAHSLVKIFSQKLDTPIQSIAELKEIAAPAGPDTGVIQPAHDRFTDG